MYKLGRMPTVEEKPEKLSSKFLAKAEVVRETVYTDHHRELAKASLADLSIVFDEDVIEEIQKNPDLLFIASTLLELGVANKNGDAVMPSDFLPVASSIKKKYINIEHQRIDVVGAIDEYAFLNNGSYIDDELVHRLIEIGEKVEYIIGGYIWRVVDKAICDFIEQSSALEDEKVSTSFEIFFDYYDICVSPTLKVLDGKIITSNSEDFKRYNSFLKAKGGNGKAGDLNVFRILRGKLILAGAGLVANPASGIKGVLALNEANIVVESIESADVDNDLDDNDDEPDDLDDKNDPEDPDDKEGDDKDESSSNVIEKPKFNNMQELMEQFKAHKNESFAAKNPNISYIITPVLSVNTQTTTIDKISKMPITIKNVEDIQSNWSELQKPEAQASVVTEFIRQKLEEESLRFAEAQKAKEVEIEAAKAAQVAADAEIVELKAKHEALVLKLAELEQKQAVAEAQTAFDNRMAEVEAEFELDDEISKLIVEEVRELQTDEAFAGWLTKKKVLLKDKTKAAVKAKKDKAEATKAAAIAAGVKPEAFAGEEINFAEVLASVKPVQANEAVTTTVVETASLKDQIRAKFASKTTVNGVKVSKTA